MPYYFESLPLHPQPERLESITSYLMRLAAANGISSVDGLSALCFPRQDRRITRELADYPPLSFEILSAGVACRDARLRATTFHHVGAKFGRSSHPQPVSRFLSRSVAPSLRYCPLCLAEQPYYSLLWRFLLLPGCVKHSCRFRDSCGHCGKRIPLFSAPFKMGECPSCDKDLQKCQPGPLKLTEKTEQMVVARTNDVEFLLTPQSWESQAIPVISSLGRLLRHLRRVQQMVAPEVAQRMGVTLSRIEGMERGNAMTRGATLNDYISYADLLGLTLQEAFVKVLPSS